MASTIFNPVAGAVSPCDGLVLWAGSQTSFATIRAKTTGTFASATPATDNFALIESGSSSGNYITLTRSVLNFDTSLLSAGATITAATLSVFVTGVQDNLSQSIGVTAVTPTGTANVVTGDMDVAKYGSTRFASDKTISSLALNAYNDWPLNADGLAYINKVGITSLSFRVSCDISNAAPTWAGGVQAAMTGRFADNGTNKPKLTVTYSAPSSAFLAFFM